MLRHFNSLFWRRLWIAFAIFNFMGAQIVPPALALNITSITVQKVDNAPTPVLTFATPTAATIAASTTLTNPATSSVTVSNAGAISYALSNSTATGTTINATTGVVTAGTTAGTATVTATQAAVANVNNLATQSYTLTVTLITPTLTGFSLSSPSVVFGLSLIHISEPTRPY